MVRFPAPQRSRSDRGTRVAQRGGGRGATVCERSELSMVFILTHFLFT